MFTPPLASCRKRLALGVILGVAAAGCRPGGDTVADAVTEAGSRAAAVVPVAVEPAAVGGIAAHYATTTTLEADKQAQVLARVSGIIKAIEVEEGQDVRLGQTLLAIENEEYRFRLAQTEAKAGNLQSRFDRLQAMSRDQDLISKEELDTARNELATARAEKELAGLMLSYTTVTAPFSGRIVRRLVDVGQNVAIGTPLFAIADLDPLLARVHVPAKELRNIQIDQPVELVLDSNGDRLEGRIKLVSPAIDPSTGTIKVTIEVAQYPRSTRPGDFVEARIITERREASTLVPRLAVITEKDEQVVYVARGEEVERRRVVVGFADDVHAEIQNGVKPGEQVVVKGQRSLRHGVRIKVLEDVAAKNAVPSPAPPQPPREGAVGS